MRPDDLTFNTPATRERIASLLARLEVGPSKRALDVGCGRGEMLAMLVSATACAGIGVDLDEDELERARAKHPKLTWHLGDVAQIDLDPPFDAAICVAATHAFGPPGKAFPSTLDALSQMIRSGGRMLVGEGYWRDTPPNAYLDATPFSEGDLVSHADNAACGERFGLTLVHQETSSHEEWDHFEGLFLAHAENRYARSPNDADAIANVQHWRGWNESYHRWGRDTLGFGFYMFEKR